MLECSDNIKVCGRISRKTMPLGYRAVIYKNKQVRDAAYKEMEEVMGIEEFGVPEIKNKIRALRSTNSQEKKIRELHKVRN